MTSVWGSKRLVFEANHVYPEYQDVIDMGICVDPNFYFTSSYNGSMLSISSVEDEDSEFDVNYNVLDSTHPTLEILGYLVVSEFHILYNVKDSSTGKRSIYHGNLLTRVSEQIEEDCVMVNTSNTCFCRNIVLLKNHDGVKDIKLMNYRITSEDKLVLTVVEEDIDVSLEAKIIYGSFANINNLVFKLDMPKKQFKLIDMTTKRTSIFESAELVEKIFKESIGHKYKDTNALLLTYHPGEEGRFAFEVIISSNFYSYEPTTKTLTYRNAEEACSPKHTRYSTDNIILNAPYMILTPLSVMMSEDAYTCVMASVDESSFTFQGNNIKYCDANAIYNSNEEQFFAIVDNRITNKDSKKAEFISYSAFDEAYHLVMRKEGTDERWMYQVKYDLVHSQEVTEKYKMTRPLYLGVFNDEKYLHVHDDGVYVNEYKICNDTYFEGGFIGTGVIYLVSEGETVFYNISLPLLSQGESASKGTHDAKIEVIDTTSFGARVLLKIDGDIRVADFNRTLLQLNIRNDKIEGKKAVWLTDYHFLVDDNVVYSLDMVEKPTIIFKWEHLPEMYQNIGGFGLFPKSKEFLIWKKGSGWTRKYYAYTFDLSINGKLSITKEDIILTTREKVAFEVPEL
ncbi:hypothetical protein PCE1_004102 [Barthelona sp. PCE]